jgi:hypothetical protein
MKKRTLSYCLKSLETEVMSDQEAAQRLFFVDSQQENSKRANPTIGAPAPLHDPKDTKHTGIRWQRHTTVSLVLNLAFNKSQREKKKPCA